MDFSQILFFNIFFVEAGRKVRIRAGFSVMPQRRAIRRLAKTVARGLAVSRKCYTIFQIYTKSTHAWPRQGPSANEVSLDCR